MTAFVPANDRFPLSPRRPVPDHPPVRRTLAERDGRDRLVFPEDLERLRGNPQMAEILTGQERIFESYQASLK
jgi:hypothetical protein